ncbi:MAG: aspartate-semialdehyde dehydrogenase [Calditrichaeota bacterium]|nr:aspartate-semialdehyde dehydrogenase [Calditrichota bacterium]
MREKTVAVVGATGLVGGKMLEILEARDFPVSRLIPVASPKSAGREISFRGEKHRVQPISPEVFKGVDIALFSAGGETSKRFAPLAAKAGAVVVDNSSAWRMHEKVPLVVPEVNPEDIEGHSGIIANPNCSTIQMVVALAPLADTFGIESVTVSTYQGVTGSGVKGVRQLRGELAGKPVAEPAYPHPIAFNCLPHIDVFEEDGFTREERKMINETRKILDLPDLPVNPTCVRVPVIGGHSESVQVVLGETVYLERVRTVLKDAPGLVLLDDPSRNLYPTPLAAHEKDEVFVGRLRVDPTNPNGLNMWVVSDNLRKGAATNAVQIAELLLEKD